MNGKSSLLFTVALVSSSFGGPTLAHAEEVNMSRLRATAVMPPQATANPLSVYQAVDPTVMDAFCGDGDGCFIRLEEVHAAPDLRIIQRLVVKSGARWNAALNESYVDGDGNEDPPGGIGTTVVPDVCLFSDVNADTQLDNAVGFSLFAQYTGSAGSTPGFTCLLTLID